MANSRTFAFDPPLQVKGPGDTVRKIASIDLREPTAAEVRNAEAVFHANEGPVSERRRDAALLTAVAGLPADDDAVVKAVPVAIFNEMVAYVRAFVTAKPLADYTRERPSELRVALEEPIEQSGQHFDCLTLREPTTGDVDAAEQEFASSMDTLTVRRFQIVLVSRVSGAPRFIVERLPIRKLDEAARYLGGFIGAGRRAGRA